MTIISRLMSYRTVINIINLIFYLLSNYDRKSHNLDDNDVWMALIIHYVLLNAVGHFV